MACALVLAGACGDDEEGGGTDTGGGNETSGSSGSSSGTGDSGSGSGGADGSADGSGGSGDRSASQGTTGTGTGGGTAAAKAVAEKLGRDHFLIGMGNDLKDDHNQDGAYTLGVTMDLHYAYLVGLKGQGGWTDWNANGGFVTLLSNVADSKGVVPMFTLYSMAAWGENNAGAVTNADYMGAYWDGAKMLFERLGEFDKPAVVHFEPDWWAFAQTQSADPSAMTVQVKDHAPDCADQPDNMVGMGHCLVALARKYAPKTLIGFHASNWAGTPEQTAEYLVEIGAGEADIVVTEMLDRDAGCYEAGTNPNCQRAGSGWYWDASNETSPNFHEHQAWAKKIVDGVGLPMLWWQLPFGVPSETPGGTDGHYRDNRVKYVFEHIGEFADIGGVGAVFGTGAAGQTYITTDGGQFKDAVTAYFDSPYPL